MKRYIGIDPGTNILGYAIIEVDKKKISINTLGVLKLGHLPEHQHKLKRIFEKIQSLIQTYKPNEMAIERTFFGKNVQSMLKLGRAQGVAGGTCGFETPDRPGRRGGGEAAEPAAKDIGGVKVPRPEPQRIDPKDLRG
ncbi:MAG: hypothetical protein HC803_09475, partial [Saprospiraceae bacterium]|nr:hypothetical protein [Saprospiraceae bacterium]